jgi:2-desacetyl-2-hydroxyethyl bacteriochlorophyllide A dehydrogenase
MENSPESPASLDSQSSPGRPSAAGSSAADAVWFSRPRTVEVRSETVGAPGPGEVRVRALRSAISHGTEMLVYRGQVDPGLALDLPTLRGSFAFPIKYGYASVACVEASGPEVTRLKIGDLVFVHHPHQTAYVVAESAAIPLPAKTDPEAGVLLANLETAVNITLDARVSLGDRVIVFGQGVVGLLLTQVLKRSGARTLIAVDPVSRRREAALLAGADAAIEPGPSLVEHVMALTDGGGADIAIEVSGNPGALDLAIDCLRFQGTIVAASWYGTKPVTLHLGGAFHRNRLRIVSSQVSHLDPALGPSWTRERRLQTAIDLLPTLKLRELITHRFSIADAPEAYRMLDEHPEDAIQVVFQNV